MPEKPDFEQIGKHSRVRPCVKNLDRALRTLDR